MKITALLLLVPAIALAQVRESVTVEVIEVPVYVTAPGNQPVRGLTRDAFELRVNGRKVPIDYFDAVELPPPSSDAAAPAPAEGRVPARERRLYLLLFDTLFSSPGKLPRTQRAAQAAMAAANPATDLFAVATYSDLKGVQFATPFVGDRAVTLRALQTLETSRAADPFGLAMATAERSQWVAPTPDGEPDYVEIGRSGRSEAPSTLAGGAAFQDLIGNQLRHHVEDLFENLGALAQRLSGLEGQKHILYFSSGFRVSLMQGGASPVSARPTTGGGLDARTLRMLYEMADIFAAAGVLLDSVDIDGIRIYTKHSEDTLDSLGVLARATGGEFVHNRNDLGRALTEVTAAQRVAYLLGFNRGTLRGGTISVRVNGVPPGTRLSYRNGFGAAAHRKDVDPLQLIDILLNDIPQHDVTMGLKVTGSDAALELRPREIAPLLAEKTPTVDTLLYIFDDRGSAVAGYEKQIDFDAALLVQKTPIVIRRSFDLPPGRYVAKAIARIRGTASVGFVRTDFTVE